MLCTVKTLVVRLFVHRVPGTHVVLYTVKTLVARGAFETVSSEGG